MNPDIENALNVINGWANKLDWICTILGIGRIKPVQELLDAAKAIKNALS